MQAVVVPDGKSHVRDVETGFVGDYADDVAVVDVLAVAVGGLQLGLGVNSVALTFASIFLMSGSHSLWALSIL